MFLNVRQQRGNSLILALFIIVLMSLLILALARQLVNSSSAVSVEVQGNRAFNAAQSGLQLGLTQLFPLNSAAPASCSVLSAQHQFSQPGLAGCSASLTCQQLVNPDQADRPLYRLVSSGHCVAGEVITSRQVVMEAY